MLPWSLYESWWNLLPYLILFPILNWSALVSWFVCQRQMKSSVKIGKALELQGRQVQGLRAKVQLRWKGGLRPGSGIVRRQISHDSPSNPNPPTTVITPSFLPARRLCPWTTLFLRLRHEETAGLPRYKYSGLGTLYVCTPVGNHIRITFNDFKFFCLKNYDDKICLRRCVPEIITNQCLSMKVPHPRISTRTAV